MTTPKEEFLTIGEVETHLRIGGEGEAVLFLHGLATANLWLPFHEELAKQYTVYAPDHPGFGQSAMPDWFDKMEDMVIHYASLLETLKLDKVNLVGFSLGGWIAAEFATFYPEKVNKLVLIDAAGLRVPNAPIEDIFALSPQEIAMLCFNDLSAAMVLIGDLSDPIKFILQDYREKTMAARLAWNPSYGPKLARRLQRVRSSTMVIWGADDRLIPLAHGEAYTRLIPGAKLEIINNCGHMPIVESGLETAAIIDRFLAGRE